MSVKDIRPGDRVIFTTPQGQTRSGRAQALLIFTDHVVVNLGGLYGTPAVVSASNYVTHRRSKRQ